MVIVLGDLPTFPNKEIIVKLHYKCKNCGCNTYKTNVGDLMEKSIQKRVEEYKIAN